MEAAPHFAISDFNSQFHTSLVHLMHWKMDTDGFWERQSHDGETEWEHATTGVHSH